MSKHTAKLAQRMPRERDADAIDIVRPAEPTNPFLSFRYSYTEISAVGGKARVKARQVRLENGKLSSEIFDGEADRTMYDNVVRDAQRVFLDQSTLFMKSLSWWLPLFQKPRPDRD